MAGLEKIENTYKWVENNCSGAVKSLSIGYPFWGKMNLFEQTYQTKYQVILETLATQLPRYSAICLLRIWDSHKDSKSIYKLRNQMNNNDRFSKSAEFAEIKAEIYRFETTDAAVVLRTMRDKMMAHTEGVEADTTNSLPIQEFHTVLSETVILVDKIKKLIFPSMPSYKDAAQAWETDRYHELKDMLKDLAVI